MEIVENKGVDHAFATQKGRREFLGLLECFVDAPAPRAAEEPKLRERAA
jgi:hypothetical protein